MKGMDSICSVGAMRRRQGAGRCVGSTKAGMSSPPSCAVQQPPPHPPVSSQAPSPEGCEHFACLQSHPSLDQEQWPSGPAASKGIAFE